jgi:hypothetical protein
MNRGHRRSGLFLHDADRQRFRRLLAELPERFGVEKRILSTMVDLSQMGLGMPTEAFDEVYEQTREKHQI